MTMHLAMTAAGLAAITDAANVGTSAVRFTKLALGAGTGTGDQSARTALIDQKEIEAVTGQASGATRIAIRADYSPTENFVVTEAGLFAQVGNGAEFLAAYWLAENAAGALASAAANTALVVAGVIVIESSDADIDVTAALNIAIGIPDNVVLKSDHATTDKRGIVELATTREARNGTDTVRAVTPAGLAARIGDIPDSVAPPNASKTRRGLVELATNGEVQTGTDDERAVTPAGLASRSATTARTGIVELATAAEAKTGTDSARAVTPAGLAGRTPNASATVRGLVELATATEASTGTDTVRAVTPAGLKGVIDALIGGAPTNRNTLKKIADAIPSLTGYATEAWVSGRNFLTSVPNATATRRGIVELATNAEVVTGTDSERAVTPASLANFFGSASKREFTTAGAHSYTWEWGATKCLAIIDGAGGGGGASGVTNRDGHTGGVGGGGGAGDRKVVLITGLRKGNAMTVTVGAGGDGGVGAAGTGNGGAGGAGAGTGGGGDGGEDSSVAVGSGTYAAGGGSGAGAGAGADIFGGAPGAGGGRSENGNVKFGVVGANFTGAPNSGDPGSGGGSGGANRGAAASAATKAGADSSAGTGGNWGLVAAADGADGATASGGSGGGRASLASQRSFRGGRGGDGKVVLYPIF